MPFCEADPWRLQYFEGVECPPEVRIPTEDPDAYEWYPQHRWVYDKLRLCASQGLTCAPHGVEPPEFPVFSKPITNLRGMGVGSRVLRDLADYRRHLTAGHLWMTLLEGEHVSTDVAVVRGRAAWRRHSRRRGHVRLLDDRGGNAATSRRLSRLMAGEEPRLLHRHGEFRDHRRPHHRCTPAFRRSVAGTLRPRLAGGGGGSVPLRGVDLPGTRAQ